jgi:LysM repeat protein
MTARIAALGRGVLRAVVILAAVVLVLAALVGVGYVAGKLLVRPGESLPATVPSAPPVTPGVAVPTPVGSGQPDASAGGSPSVPGGSGPPAPSATAPATDPPTPTPKPTPRPTPKPRVYVVKSGDTLFAIAERFGVTVNAIIEANDIADPNAIYTGQRLTIPRP